MRSIVLKSCLLFLFPCIFSCCQDLLVNDISDMTVKTYSPADSTSITTTNVTFWWEDIEDATQYNIQVVSPSFHSVQKLWYDSIVSTNKINFELTPGSFEWRVKALNDVSETDFTTNAFRIDSTQNLSNQTIILFSPTNGSALNADSALFRWSKLYNASNYKFKLVDQENKTLIDQTVNDAIFSATLPSDGIYQWSVSAHNEISSTISYSSSFIIDRKEPEMATLVTPTNKSIIYDGDSVHFQWERIQDEGSEFIDNLIVAKDENLSHPVLSTEMSQNNYSDTLSSGSYYWTVIRKDKAGNQCEKKTVWQFTKN